MFPWFHPSEKWLQQADREVWFPGGDSGVNDTYRETEWNGTGQPFRETLHFLLLASQEYRPPFFPSVRLTWATWSPSYPCKSRYVFHKRILNHRDALCVCFEGEGTETRRETDRHGQSYRERARFTATSYGLFQSDFKDDRACWRP